MAGNEEVLAGIGELIFSLMISYFGALEFLFVARHLYHWSFQHPSSAADASADTEELPRLRQRLEELLNEAAAREASAGRNAMQDGVLYSNGIRIDPAELNHMPVEKLEALEAELQRQQRIQQETRKQLAAAEAKLAEERSLAEEKRKAEEQAAEHAKQLIEAEKRKAAEQREQEENEKKLREAEKQREIEQRQREEQENKVREAERQEREANERKLREIEKQREIEQREREEQESKLREAERQEREANERKLREIEEQREIEQREREEHENKVRQAEQKEREESERKLQAAEKQREAEQREQELQEAEQREREQNESRLAAAEEARQAAQRQAEIAEAVERQLLNVKSHGDETEQERRDAEIVERLLAAERERKLSATESELEEEAVMAEQARRLLSNKAQLDNKQKLIDENARRFLEAEEEMVMLQQRMLEAAQDAEYAGQVPVIEEPCIKKYVPPRFEEPALEEEPTIVQTVKTQMGQGNSGEEAYKVKSKTLMFPGVSDEGSSVEPNSSQQSSFSTQPSDDCTNEAVRLDLEAQRQEPEGEDNVPDVQYTEEYLRSLDGIKSRNLVREDGSGRRRAFKKRRSSGSSNSSRDSRASRDDELKMFTSLEDEELRRGDKEDYNPIKYTSEPTLRVKSQHRRHKRSPAKDVKSPGAEASSSLEMLGEENTNPWGELMPEHYKDTEFWKREKALSIDEEELELEKHASGEEAVEPEPATAQTLSFETASEAQNHEAVTALTQQSGQDETEKLNTEASKTLADTSSNDAKSNLQTSDITETHSRNSSPGLRRSPRVDEMDHYEQRWVESEADAVSKASASQPPSITVRQPDTAPWRDQYGLLMEGLSDFYDFTASVNPSRSRSASRTTSPVPKNVANLMDVDKERSLELYDDTNELTAGELNCELVLQLLESSLQGAATSELQLQQVADDASQSSNQMLPLVYETADDDTPNAMLEALREERCRSRSRSRSPLPTSRNLEQSISLRKQRRIKQNDELYERLNRAMDVEPDSSSSDADAALPQPVSELNDMAAAACVEDMEEDTPETIRQFVERLRVERSSRSRSRSPLPNASNIERSLETRRQKRIQHNDEVYEKLQQQERMSSQSPELAGAIATMPAPPSINIECIEAEVEADEPVDTPESMARLFEQLRLDRMRSHSRSRSKSPLPSAANLEHSLEQRRQKLIAQNEQFFEQLQQRASSPEPPRLTVEHVYEYVEAAAEADVRELRSLSPSRSRSNSPQSNGEEDFQLMLNLEGSAKRTLSKHSEALESVLAAKQRELDKEALLKLTNAQEEVELRLLSPSETAEQLPDYARTTSEVARDIKEQIMDSNFKRSTYVGESMDLGSEFEALRREAARFQRSRSPSPAIAALDLAESQAHAAAQRELQAAILDSLTTASTDENRLGAKPKTNAYDQLKDTRLTSGAAVELSAAQLDDMRHQAADFQRSRSRSRSPLAAEQVNVLKNIDAEAAKRELQDELLDQLAASTVNFQNFSRYLNADFLDSERRASDSALMQSDPYADLEPEEYHHFRRYSLAQEQPVEEYPSDDFVYVSQIEVRTATGTRTWLKEDFYTQDLDSLDLCLADSDSMESLSRENRRLVSADKLQALEEGAWAAAEFDATNAIYNFDIFGDYSARDNYDDGSSNDSEDERQTVVEMEDEFDEGISDNNERTQPTDESHHDTSECEEAERNADRYANRGANDWNEADDVEDFLEYGLDDGAVGGVTPYSDADSFIEQIYNEAVKNRKQSGILREYETMVMEQLPADSNEQSESDKEKSSSDSEGLSSKKRNRQLDAALGLGYLGDADVVARQATRLRTRYGYNPQLQAGMLDADIDVDLNYKPKREYNWRKNFKLDDTDTASSNEHGELTECPDVAATAAPQTEAASDTEQLLPAEEENGTAVPLDLRRFSLGGESITLFSRSPVREILPDVQEETVAETENAAILETTAELATIEKPKKKKSKKKLRKGAKSEEQLQDDNDSDTQPCQRRGSEETPAEASTEPVKRKTRSRRSSKSSLTSEDANGNGLFSPRSSLAFVGEALAGIDEQAATEATDSLPSKKKVKKRSKKTQEQQSTAECATQLAANIDESLNAALAEIAPVAISVSTQMSPDCTQEQVLSVLSTGQSVCVTPASSVESTTTVQPVSLSSSQSVTGTPTTNAVATRSIGSIVDSFDILKDANFYPLF